MKVGVCPFGSFAHGQSINVLAFGISAHEYPEGTDRATSVDEQLPCLWRDLRAGSTSREVANSSSELCRRRSGMLSEVAGVVPPDNQRSGFLELGPCARVRASAFRELCPCASAGRRGGVGGRFGCESAWARRSYHADPVSGVHLSLTETVVVPLGDTTIALSLSIYIYIYTHTHLYVHVCIPAPER